MKYSKSYAISKGLGDALSLILDGGSLPPIRGTWYFVDPKSGADTSDGRTVETALAGVRAAYGKCTSGAGDGIVFLAREDGTTADTTSYLGGSLLWTKDNITFVGVGGGHVYNGRCRIASLDRVYAASTLSWTAPGVMTDSAEQFIVQGFEVGDQVLVAVTAGTAITVVNKITAVTAGTITLADAVTANAAPGASTISTHAVPVLNVSGENNIFKNLAFIQGGNDAEDIGAVIVSADHNYFEDCYFNGAGNATQAAEITANDLTLNASACIFKHCFFGSNSTIRAAANAHIVLGIAAGQIGQNFFEDCYVTSYSATAGHCAIFITNAATLGGWVQFKGCSFVNWDSGAVTALTAVVGGVDPTNLGLLMKDCTQIGWAIWADTGWDCVYTHNSVGAGTAGIALISG
ncbi:MAG: hypothetical protein IMZ62_16655 [Chloroflexi bacterium]|nr:hypothetical protein [Chloroflexota bacterium]